MSDDHVFHDISVDTHEQDIFPNIYDGKWCVYNPSGEKTKGGRNTQQLRLGFHRKTPLKKKYLQQILPIFMLAFLVIFNSFGSWCTYGIYIANNICMFFHYSIKQYHDNDFDEINAHISGYLFQGIMIHWWRINSQHFFVSPSFSHEISIDIYKQEILPTFMLEDGVYITISLNIIQVE